MDYDYNDRKQASVYSRRLKAGKRRTYFFDVRETKGNDYFLTITESRKRFNEDGYERHKIFLYKEDFNKFMDALGEAVQHVKTELMPDYDFDSYSHEGEEQEAPYARNSTTRSGTHPAGLRKPGSQQNSYNPELTENAPLAFVQPQGELETETEQEEAAVIDTAAIEAEPMEAIDAGSESEEGEDILNANATSGKLASEEVEKW